MLPVLIAFAGVLIAAVATGMIAGRCVRGSGMCFAVWTVAALGLMVALAAAGVGLATGFTPATFRAVEIGAQLIAPLWLAWGLIELVSRSEAVRLGARLSYGFVLTAVAGLILAADPLSAMPFSKAWPVAGQHYQPVPRDALLLAQAAAIAGTLAAVSVAWARARSEPEWAPLMAGVGALGLAVLLTVLLRFSLPARSAYPLAAALAAGLVWFGVTRGLRTVDESWRPVGRGDRSWRRSRSRRDGQRQDDRGYEQDYQPQDYERQDYEPQRHEPGQYRQDEYGRSQYGRYNQDQRVPDPYAQGQYGQDAYGQAQYAQEQYAQEQYGQAQRSRDQYGQGQPSRDQYGQGQPSRDQPSRDQPSRDRYSQGQHSQGQHSRGQHSQGQQSRDQQSRDQQSRDQQSRDQYGREQYAQDQYSQGQYPQEQYNREQYGPDPYSRDPYGQEQYRPTSSRQGSSGPDRYGSDRYGSERRGPDPYGPGTGHNGYGRDGRYEGDGRAERSGSQPTAVPLSQQLPEMPAVPVAEDELPAPTARGGSQSRPYGRLQIFTLLDDKAADFDRLAEQTAEEVRIGEPDTLVYVIHLVPNAPMQRIFYEIYRDRAAFDSHENKSYTKRFVSERRAYVLATNVIELRLKYAKVAPLPVDSRQLDAGRTARAQLPPGPTPVTPRHEATTARHAASAPRQAGSSGQWAQPPADPRYGRV
jgi:quinol monooxygenase YgiN